MIDKICTFLTNRIRKEMPDIDDERAEVINYGLQNIIGEIPKTFLVLIIAYFLGIWKETLLTFILLIPYKNASGGFHLKTHLGCIIGTTIFYCGIPVLAKLLIINEIVKYIIIVALWIFGMCMIRLYAPADTENVPILTKKNIIFGYLLQTLMITKLAYRLTNNKYGYEVYGDASAQNV